jgi:hypothetical protein
MLELMVWFSISTWTDEDHLSPYGPAGTLVTNFYIFQCEAFHYNSAEHLHGRFAGEISPTAYARLSLKE